MSELSDNKKVRELVEGAFGSDENPWISETGAETATFRIVREAEVSLEGVRDIYSRRGKRNRERGGLIEGFECLLKNLDKTDSPTVRIHGMTVQNGREYLIFTDGGIEELIGILRFPLNQK